MTIEVDGVSLLELIFFSGVMGGYVLGNALAEWRYRKKVSK